MPFFTKLLPFFKIAHARTQEVRNQQPSSSNDSRNKGTREEIIYITKEEFMEPIQDEYLRRLSQMSPEEIYDNYNPGPTKPDGSVNFECHCVSHLVASPCGYAFRKAITCQKAASEEDLDKGACAEEFMEFLDCVMKTQCFRRSEGAQERSEEEEKAPS